MRRAGYGAAALVLVVLTVLLSSGCTDGQQVGPSTPPPPPSSRASTTGTPAPIGPDDWPTYHHDNARTGAGTGIAPLSALSVAWTARLDGAVYGQPLVLGDRVLAATEHDTVYALNRSDGRVLWSARLGDPQPLSGLPCGNIDPLGITGTPAYDPATGLVFVVAETDGGHHTLAGIDVTTGEVALSRPLDPPRGDVQVHQQRSALTVLDGWVYVAFGGLDGDCGTYFGTVLAAPTTGLGPLRTFVVPTPGKGGIWAPGGATVSGGKLFYPIGNGDSTSTYDHTDAVLALDPQLSIVDGFSPAEWADDNENDLDLGSMTPAVTGQHVFVAGKRGIGYVLDANHLGSVGGQLGSAPICRGFGGPAVDGATIYVPCADRTRAVTVDQSGTPTIRWTASVPCNGSPVIGGGAIWTADYHSGRLYALDPATGHPLAQLDVGPLPHFASPTLATNHAYLGTLSGITAITGA